MASVVAPDRRVRETPFSCVCYGQRFVQVSRWNKHCCPLHDDPVVIKCSRCGRLYEQSPEWEWTQVVQ